MNEPMAKEPGEDHSQPAAGGDDFASAFPKQLFLWLGICWLSAIPSLVWASNFNMAGVAAGICVFVAAYAVVGSTAWARRLRRDRRCRVTLYVGYGTRLAISVLFPAGMAVDLFTGMLSISIVEVLFGRGGIDLPGGDPGFFLTFVITCLQGCFMNIVLGLYMLIVFGFVAAFSKKEPEFIGLCLTCGYDLRASPVTCPECGTPVPAEHRVSV